MSASLLGTKVPYFVVGPRGALEGTRPILLEIQALVAPTDLAMPRRVGTGVDPKRLAMIVAVLLMCGWLISMQEPADRGTVASILCFIVCFSFGTQLANTTPC